MYGTLLDLSSFYLILHSKYSWTIVASRGGLGLEKEMHYFQLGY